MFTKKYVVQSKGNMELLDEISFFQRLRIVSLLEILSSERLSMQSERARNVVSVFVPDHTPEKAFIDKSYDQLAEVCQSIGWSFFVQRVVQGHGAELVEGVDACLSVPKEMIEIAATDESACAENMPVFLCRTISRLKYKRNQSPVDKMRNVARSIYSMVTKLMLDYFEPGGAVVMRQPPTALPMVPGIGLNDASFDGEAVQMMLREHVAKLQLSAQKNTDNSAAAEQRNADNFHLQLLKWLRKTQVELDWVWQKESQFTPRLDVTVHFEAIESSVLPVGCPADEQAELTVATLRLSVPPADDVQIEDTELLSHKLAAEVFYSIMLVVPQLALSNLAHAQEVLIQHLAVQREVAIQPIDSEQQLQSKEGALILAAVIADIRRSRKFNSVLFPLSGLDQAVLHFARTDSGEEKKNIKIAFIESTNNVNIFKNFSGAATAQSFFKVQKKVEFQSHPGMLCEPRLSYTAAFNEIMKQNACNFSKRISFM